MKFIKIIRGRGAWGVRPYRVLDLSFLTVGGGLIFSIPQPPTNENSLRLLPTAWHRAVGRRFVSSVQWHSRLGGLASELLCGNSNSLGTVELSGSD